MQLPQPQVPLEPPPPPPELLALLRDLKVQDFQEWRRHPVSLVVHHFLAHRAADMTAATVAGWLQQGAKLEQAEMIRGQILALNGVLALEWAELLNFYANRQIQGDHPREGPGSNHDRGDVQGNRVVGPQHGRV